LSWSMSNGCSNSARTEFHPAGRLDSVVHGFEFLDRSSEQHNACAMAGETARNKKVLAHLEREDAAHAARRLPPSRAPRQASLFA